MGRLRDVVEVLHYPIYARASLVHSSSEAFNNMDIGRRERTNMWMPGQLTADNYFKVTRHIFHAPNRKSLDALKGARWTFLVGQKEQRVQPFWSADEHAWTGFERDDPFGGFILVYNVDEPVQISPLQNFEMRIEGHQICADEDAYVDVLLDGHMTRDLY